MIASAVLVLGPVFPTPQVDQLVTSLRDGLGQAGRNVEVGYRGFAADAPDPLLDVASEIDRLRPAVVVAWGARCARDHGYAYNPPVVFVVNGDPADLALAATRKMSGLTAWMPGLVREQLAILKELVPDARRVAVLWDPSDSGSIRAFNESREPARGFGLQRESLEARRYAELESAFSIAGERDVDAVCVLSSPLSVAHSTSIARLAQRYRLPAVADLGEFAQAGVLVAYGASLQKMFRRAGFHVRRLLEGARLGELGVERLTTPELVVNLRTAQSLGVAVSPSVLARAHRRID